MNISLKTFFKHKPLVAPAPSTFDVFSEIFGDAKELKENFGKELSSEEWDLLYKTFLDSFVGLDLTQIATVIGIADTDVLHPFIYFADDGTSSQQTMFDYEDTKDHMDVMTNVYKFLYDDAVKKNPPYCEHSDEEINRLIKFYADEKTKEVKPIKPKIAVKSVPSLPKTESKASLAIPKASPSIYKKSSSSLPSSSTQSTAESIIAEIISAIDFGYVIDWAAIIRKLVMLSNEEKKFLFHLTMRGVSNLDDITVDGVSFKSMAASFSSKDKSCPRDALTISRVMRCYAPFIARIPSGVIDPEQMPFSNLHEGAKKYWCTPNSMHCEAMWKTDTWRNVFFEVCAEIDWAAALKAGRTQIMNTSERRCLTGSLRKMMTGKPSNFVFNITDDKGHADYSEEMKTKWNKFASEMLVFQHSMLASMNKRNLFIPMTEALLPKYSK